MLTLTFDSKSQAVIAGLANFLGPAPRVHVCAVALGLREAWSGLAPHCGRPGNAPWQRPMATLRQSHKEVVRCETIPL